MFRLSSTPINRDDHIRELEDEKAGALVVFEGRVRNHNEGKKVSSLEYQVYEALALKEGHRILGEAKKKFNLHRVVCTHRSGHLSLGETAVWVGAVSSHRDDAFRATRYVIDEIKHRLPVWKKEHYTDQAAKWVFCRDHQHHVHFEEKDYYQKQAKLVSQDVLRRARVLVVGAGGLGCPVLTGLAMAGVGHITVADHDVISLTNIHRQPLFSPELVGEKKATVAAVRLSALNPFIEVVAINQYVSASNAEEILKDRDLILDCTDNLATKFLLHDAAFRFRIPLISASIYQHEGQVRTFVPGNLHGCLRCTHAETPDDGKLGNCNDFGVLGTSVAAIGSIQASEAIQFLLSGANNSIERTFFLNLRTLSQMKIKNRRRENCPTCAGDVTISVSPLEIGPDELSAMDAILVDVRNEEDSVLRNYVTEKRAVVVACHKGVRSRRLVEAMRSEGHGHFYSLRGGSCSH